ncbi:MAG: ABC transporter permease, partial [Clostridia bacterium]|nr:ABC transporter permease [Clostridia bacterium]
LIAGKIDLSTGSQVALSGVIVAVFGKNMTAAGYDLTLACILGMVVSLLMAGACGTVHATIQNKYNIPPFIITLATQYVLFGLGATICNNYPIPNMYPQWFVQLGMGRLFGVVPLPVIIFLFLWAVCYFVMEHTSTGRSIYAIGGNQEAARLSGINVFKSKAVVFITVQVCASIAGWVNSAMVMNADWTYAKDWPMDCITMAIIGGTSMTGGSGRIWGTLVGVVLISVLINGMTILNWNIYIQYIVRGAILLGSLLVMTYRDKMMD